MVTDYLDKLCDLPPDRGLRCDATYCGEAYLVFGQTSNYERWVPEEKIDDVLRTIKEVVWLPGAKPKWYHEDIDLHDWGSEFCSGTSTWSLRFMTVGQ